jgi:HK97 family phage prohead protease
VITRTIAGALEVRETDAGRTITGLAVPYDVPTPIGPYVERMARGVFAEATADPSSVKLMAQHDHDALPIGRAMSLTETERGLEAELLVSNTVAGRDVLTLVRDGVATGLSVGFIPRDDEWAPDRSAVTRMRATLVEISVVALPAYADAQITAVRQAAAHARLMTLARLHAAR